MSHEDASQNHYENSFKFRQRVFSVLNNAKDQLETEFNIRDITTIEGVELRKIVEQVLRQKDKEYIYRERVLRSGLTEEEKHRAQQRYVDGIIDHAAAEAAYRWILLILGSTSEEAESLVYTYTLTYKDGGVKQIEHPKTYLALVKRFNELHKNSNVIGIQHTRVINPDFIDYFARVRDRMHNPELETYHPPKE